MPYYPLPPAPPIFGDLFPLAYTVGVLLAAVCLVVIATRRDQQKICSVMSQVRRILSGTNPISTGGILTAVFGLVGAVVIVVYWCTFFTSVSTMVVTCDWYVAYESSFPLADGATGLNAVGRLGSAVDIYMYMYNVLLGCLS